MIGPELRTGLALGAALGGASLAGAGPWHRLADLARAAFAGGLERPSLLEVAGATAAALAVPVGAAALATVAAIAVSRRLWASRQGTADHRSWPGPGRRGLAGAGVVVLVVLAVPAVLLGDLLVAVRARPGAALAGLLTWTLWLGWTCAAALVGVGLVRAGRVAAPPPRRHRAEEQQRP